MEQRIIVDSAKVMAKGQITLPKDIREQLKLSTGDRITLVCDGDKVMMMNSAVYAMQVFQKDMQGQAQSSNLNNDDDVMELISQLRTEGETE